MPIDLFGRAVLFVRRRRYLQVLIPDLIDRQLDAFKAVTCALDRAHAGTRQVQATVHLLRNFLALAAERVEQLVDFPGVGRALGQGPDLIRDHQCER